MSDITINNDESQNKNQKTTPVIESSLVPDNKFITLPGKILLSWLGMRDSNPRMLGPEPSALPLGESPIKLPRVINLFIRSIPPLLCQLK